MSQTGGGLAGSAADFVVEVVVSGGITRESRGVRPFYRDREQVVGEGFEVLSGLHRI